MTEDEAKTKWCPFARVIDTRRQPSPTAYNRVIEDVTRAAERLPGNIKLEHYPEMVTRPSSGALCLGSGCALWVGMASFEGRCGMRK